MLLKVVFKNGCCNHWWIICLRLNLLACSTPSSKASSFSSYWRSKCRNLLPSTSLPMRPFCSVSAKAQNPVIGIWLHFASNRSPGYKWCAPHFSNHTKVTANFFKFVEFIDFLSSKTNLINPVRPLHYDCSLHQRISSLIWQISAMLRHNRASTRQLIQYQLSCMKIECSF